MNATRCSISQAMRITVVFFAIASLPAFGQSPGVSPTVRSELAPTGKLRVALHVTNAVVVTKDGPAEEMQGIAVDLARAFAKRLGVEFEPVRYRTPAALADGARAGEWDIAFLGYNPEWMTEMDVAGAHVEIGETYLVAEASRIHKVEDADRPGHRIVALPRSQADQHLSKHLRQAELIRDVRSYGVGIDLISAGKADALAGNHATLSGWAAKKPGFRVATGSFLRIAHVLAVAKGRPAGLSYAKEFIEHAKTSGLIQQAVERAGLVGVTAAPAAQ